MHGNSTFVVPHTGYANQHGTYYVSDDNYYYTPQTSTTHVVAKPVTVEFGGFSHAEDLSGRLEEQTNEFLLDLHYNYSHNAGFGKIYAEGYQLLEVAKYVHAADHASDREAMRSKLSGIDALFHHIQGDVRGWSRDHHRQVGQLGILSKMDMIESTLHHLMNDVGVEQAPAPGATMQNMAPSIPAAREVAPPPAG